MLLASLIQCIGKRHRVKELQNLDKNAVLLLEIIFYLVFLVTATIYSVGLTDYYMYYYNDVLKKTFVDRSFNAREGGPELDYSQIVSMTDWWKYMEDVFVEGLSTGEQGLNVYSNLLLGSPRIRQLKVRNNTCEIHDQFKRYFRSCYSSYSQSLEDLGGNQNEEGSSQNSGEFPVRSESSSLVYWGELAFYGGGGFIENLSPNSTESLAILERLKDKHWIDAATRLIVVEFTLFNANVDLFAAVKLIAEAPPTGGLLPKSSFQSLRLHVKKSTFGYFYLFNKAFYFVQIIWFTIEEFVEMRKQKWKYFKSFFNWIDLIILLISYAAIAFLIFRYFYWNDLMQNFKENPSKHLSLDMIGLLHFHYTNMIGVCVFFIWIKFFKYISFNKTMREFSKTLQRCAKDLIGFGVMFSIVFIAFAQLGYSLFGTEIYDYRYFSESVFTLMRTILGDFEYSNIERANRVLGPIYFLTYIFLVFFILLNMFLAIINDTYSAVKEEEKESEGASLGKYIKKRFMKFCNLFGCGEPQCSLERLKSKAECSRVEDVCKRKTISSVEEGLASALGIAKCVEEPSTEKSSKMIIRPAEVLGTIFEEIEPDETCMSETSLQIEQVCPRKVKRESLCLEERVTNLECIMDDVVEKMNAIIDRLENTKLLKCETEEKKK